MRCDALGPATGISKAVRSLAALAVALFSFIAPASPALAGSPSWRGLEEVTLPDGTLGRFGLVAGEGLFSPDPVKAMVVDASGKLLAATPSFRGGLYIDCDGERPTLADCEAYDANSNSVLRVAGPFIANGPVLDLSKPPYWEIGLVEGGFVEGWAGFFRYPAYVMADHRMWLLLAVSTGFMTGLALVLILPAASFYGLGFKVAGDLAYLIIVPSGIFLVTLIALMMVPFGLLWTAVIAIGAPVYFWSRLFRVLGKLMQ